jgi:allantoin racemase
LPCPVVSPGLAAYKACETLLDLGLAHSKLAYPSPESTCDSIFHSVPRIF